MNQRMVYLNGEFVPETEARIPIFDAGFHLGDTVYEVTRTFHHRPFRMKDHLARLSRSLRHTRIDAGLAMEELDRICAEVLERNRPLLKEREEYLLTVSITRGRLAIFGADPSGRKGATVVVNCWPVPFAQFARYYQCGVHAVTPATRHSPPQCLDPKVKVRSRMHYVLADLEAQLVDPQAYALLLDVDGNVTEGVASNFFIADSGVLKTPTSRGILCGISRMTTLELAKDLGIPSIECNMQLYDIVNADEAFFTTTSVCMLPASRINGIRIGTEVPGPLTKTLLDAWSRYVGLDIVGQALGFVVAGAQ